jgi:dimethylglycine dehydrogenase
VIGGGVVGCSVLYHLARLGWKDIVLCERKELTAGSSWHAAGIFHALNGDAAMSRLQAYTIGLYRELEEISGQDIGLHYTGGISVAATDERWNLLRSDCERHRVLGLDTHLLTPREVAERFPLMDVSDVKGALYDPMEGYLDPYGATVAYAKAARKLGAEILRHTMVSSLTPLPRGGWVAGTDGETFEVEHVVNAAGLWAREVGRMAGVELPLIPMEHHYLITEDIPEIAQLGHELPVVVDLDGEMYLRPEGRGLLLGVYERDATPWSRDGTPWEFGDNELLAPQLDRLTESLEKGFRRFPRLDSAGIRKIVNGPFTFTPDGNPLVGPVPGVRNFWSACGVMAGFAQGGGVGRTLAEWMVGGEPEGDVFGLDVARFGAFATRSYVAEKSAEFYSRRFRIAYPNEFWPAARPAKVTPLHERHAASRAVFGVSFGVETPLYFAPEGEPPSEQPSIRRSNSFTPVAAECRASREAAGVLDISTFAKYEVAGSGAAAELDRLLAGRLPAPGRIRLTPMLAPSGRLMGDLTTFCESEGRYLLFGSGYLQDWHMRWFAEQVDASRASVRNVTEAIGGIAIFGPRSREMLAALAREDVGDSALPLLAFRRFDVASAPALVARLSVTGELGYEIYVPAMYLQLLYDRLRAVGADVGLRSVGSYALNSLRLEKGYGYWSREYSRDYTPMMSGLSRFVDYDKPRDFIGKDAARRERDAPPARRLVLLEVEALDAEASLYEPISAGKRVAGFVTSGGFGHTIGRSLAMGYVDARIADEQVPLEVSIIGDRRPCRILAAPPVDPRGERLRS